MPLLPKNATCTHSVCNPSWQNSQVPSEIAKGITTLTYDRLDLVADPGLTMYTYTAARPAFAHPQASRLETWGSC